LNKSYQDLYRSYNSNTKRNLKKSGNYSLEIKENLTIETIANFKSQNSPHFSSLHASTILGLLKSASKKESLKTYTAFENGKIIATVAFIVRTKRSVMILSVSNSRGQECRAMFKLIDHYIKLNSNQSLILDFEGSSIEGIARFFKGFGAIKEPYVRLISRPMKWINSIRSR
jgi:hypothetical protein